MANTFKRYKFDGRSTAADTDMAVYTPAAGVTAVVISAIAANVLNTQTTYTVRIDEADGEHSFLGSNLPLQEGSSEEMAEGRPVLEEGDALVVQAGDDNALTYRISVLEIT